VSAISPYRAARARVRAEAVAPFIEVHVSAPLQVCEARDPKGLYRLARAGRLSRFTGVSDPYEMPIAPDVVCPSHEEPVSTCVSRILHRLAPHLPGLGALAAADRP